jgi:hypothetical protein
MSPWLQRQTEENSPQRLTSKEKWSRRESSLRQWTNIALLIAVAIGVAVAAMHGETVSASLTAFGAAIGLGGVLGFLFGIPAAARVQSTNAPQVVSNLAVAGNTPANLPGGVLEAGGSLPAGAAGAAGTGPQGVAPRPIAVPGDGGGAGAQGVPPAAAGVAGAGGPAIPTVPNAALVAEAINSTPSSGAASGQQTTGIPQAQPSNLEQVADWVTKLLLGGGLTQIQQIPPLVWRWSRVVALGMLGNEARGNQVSEQLILAQQAFAAGLLVYGFILGFFGGFLITKLQLGRAISEN